MITIVKYNNNLDMNSNTTNYINVADIVTM